MGIMAHCGGGGGNWCHYLGVQIWVFINWLPVRKLKEWQFNVVALVWIFLNGHSDRKSILVLIVSHPRSFYILSPLVAPVVSLAALYCNFWSVAVKWDSPFWVTFHFERHSILSDIPFWATFHFEWHSILSDIPFWVTFYFELHSIFNDIPFWVTFRFELHSILSYIPFLVTFNFQWYFIFNDIWVRPEVAWNCQFPICESVRL